MIFNLNLIKMIIFLKLKEGFQSSEFITTKIVLGVRVYNSTSNYIPHEKDFW